MKIVKALATIPLALLWNLLYVILAGRVTLFSALAGVALVFVQGICFLIWLRKSKQELKKEMMARAEVFRGQVEIVIRQMQK